VKFYRESVCLPFFNDVLVRPSAIIYCGWESALRSSDRRPK